MVTRNIRTLCVPAIGVACVLISAGCGHRSSVSSRAGALPLIAKLPGTLPHDQQARIATEQWKAQQAAMWQSARMRAQSATHK